MPVNFDQLISSIQSDNALNERKYDSQHPPRGLPDHEALLSLAATYLSEQAKNWPEVYQPAVAPSATPQLLEQMAIEFEVKSFSGVIPDATLPTAAKGAILAAAYARYSDANSNPRSLDQQLINVLTAAARHRFFVPWAYVFADAATTGTNDHRCGYKLVKQLIPRPSVPIAALIIDELGRASRDLLEALTLGRLIDDCQKRLIGFSDNYDSASPMSKWQLTIFAMMHEEFVKQLKEKVSRGMNDAFALGKPLYMPGYGYSLIPVLGTDGVPLVGSDGKVQNRVVINEAEAINVLRIFELFAIQKVTPPDITRLLNSEGLGGRSWTSTQVRNMLFRQIYRDSEVWGKTQKRFDPMSNKVKTIQIPEDQWQWREMEHLRIIDDSLWDTAQATLKTAVEPTIRKIQTLRERR